MLRLAFKVSLSYTIFGNESFNIVDFMFDFFLGLH